MKIKLIKLKKCNECEHYNELKKRLGNFMGGMNDNNK
jgi:hypothetical protein